MFSITTTYAIVILVDILNRTHFPDDPRFWAKNEGADIETCPVCPPPPRFWAKNAFGVPMSTIRKIRTYGARFFLILTLLMSPCPSRFGSFPKVLSLAVARGREKGRLLVGYRE